MAATLPTPFDDVITDIQSRGYHNQRLGDHSDVISEGIWRDLLATCPALRADADAGVVKRWLNVGAPGGRERKIDLFVGEPGDDGKPDVSKIRIGVENKSVVTAHRNRDARFDDLSEVLAAIYKQNQIAVLVATVLVGVASRVLNVADRVKAMNKADFEAKIKPRLSTGDTGLWTDFPYAVSNNRADEPAKTIRKFQMLPTRAMAHTNKEGYDCVVLVPVHVDNVDKPRVERSNNLGIDVDKAYQDMLKQVCKAYTARFHG